MSTQMITPNALTTVQDLGRSGYQAFDVPVSGTMDLRTIRPVNVFCDNPEEKVVLEYTLLDPALEFIADNIIALTDSGLGATLDGQPPISYGVYAMKSGQMLRFTAPRTGCRAYPVLHGGPDIPPVMGNHSTYLKAKLGDFSGCKLEKDDELGFRASMATIPNLDVRRFTPEFVPREVYTLRVVLEPQDNALSKEGLQIFLNEAYTVTPEFDRMGCHLNGVAITHKSGADIVSDGIVFGVIQALALGTPIIIPADRQTTGSYTKVVNVISADFHLLTQLKMNDKVRFAEISVTAAQDAKCTERNTLRVSAYAFERWDSILKVGRGHYFMHIEDDTKLTLREACTLARDNKLIAVTSVLCPDYVKANLLILPAIYADGFLRFTSWNPKACPVLEVMQEKSLPSFLAPGANLCMNFLRYHIFSNGEVSEGVREMKALWDIGSVGLLLGYLTSLGGILLAADPPMRHMGRHRAIPIYQTKLRTCPADPLRSPVLASIRPLPQVAVRKAYQLTEPMEPVHGVLAQIGTPEEIGIADLNKPDLGEAASIRDGETPVFWSFSATVQVALRFAKLPPTITDVPGYPLVSDIRNDALLELF